LTAIWNLLDGLSPSEFKYVTKEDPESKPGLYETLVTQVKKSLKSEPKEVKQVEASSEELYQRTLSILEDE